MDARNKLYEHQREVVDKNIVLTADGLKNMYLGIDECKKTVLEIFEHHNDKIKSQIGKDYSIATHKKLSAHLIILQLLSRQSTSVQICFCMR